MGIQEVQCKEYTCDGCGKDYLVATDDAVTGTYINWTTIDAGGTGGKLWICKDACMPKAFKNRFEIERAKDRRPV